jgi:uncharacterized membrane protein YvlD (DUF360 family)
MKKILKTLFIWFLALKITSLLITSISFNNNVKTTIIAAAALAGFEYLIKPIANILFLPINLLTLGTLRWIINVIGLYLITIFINGFTISKYYFPGINWQGLIIPSISFSLIATYILSAFLLNLIFNLFHWLLK